MSTSKEKLYLEAKQAYYYGTPILSDADFDALEDSIRKENPDAAILSITGAPIPKENLLTKATHRMFMGSQEKINSEAELLDWLAKKEKEHPNLQYHISAKGDGLSLALHYKNGVLREAITRGDGTIGENITFTAKNFKKIPLLLKKPWTCEIRCEAVLKIEDWKLVDPDQKTNPRNVAGGILGRLDQKDSEHISLLGIGLEGHPEIPENESEVFELLQDFGFETPIWEGNCNAVKLITFKRKMDENRASLQYWIDGLVIRIEDIELQKELGITGNKPKGQVAWKFAAEQQKSRLLQVEWQLGQSGTLTPVGHIEPTRLGGTTVKKASLANMENIQEKKFFIGAEVLVEKANDIIPYISKTLTTFDASAGHKNIEAPTACPVCNGAIGYRKNSDKENSVYLCCTNKECQGKLYGAIERFIESRNVLGMGSSIIDALLKNKLVTGLADVFELTPEKIENLKLSEKANPTDLFENNVSGVTLGRKRADSICKEIQEKGRKMKVSDFLGSLGVRFLRERRAELLIKENPQLQNIESWFDGTLLNIQTDESDSKRIIFEELKEKESEIRNVLKHITLETLEEKPKSENSLVFCITGSLPSGKKKKDYAPLLEAKGHILVDDLTKEVQFLVIADPNGAESSKTKKAKKLGIPLINEETLNSYL
jgi:DNA ligase (NAD+)